MPAARVAADLGVCGGVSWSSNASLCAFVVSRGEPWIGERDDGEAGDIGAGGVPAMGEKGPLMWGEAPSRPMIDGSR